MPGRRPWRSGTVLFLLVVLGGCDRLAVGDGARRIELDDGAVTLPAGARVHEVSLRGAPTGAVVPPLGPESLRVDDAGATPSRPGFAPPLIQGRPGDAVRFTAADALTHAVAFDTDGLSDAAREFLGRTGQFASPPLITSGVAWVVSLDGAPAGDYPFECLAHPGERGLLRVVAAGPS